MLAHHMAGGCPMRTGDLIGTGTLSGTMDQELGCLLEATLYGKKPYHAQPESPFEDAIVVHFSRMAMK